MDDGFPRPGVRVTPRRPRFDYDGLEREIPRVWHPGGMGATAFLEALSALAPVVERFFVDDARRLLPRVADAGLRAELDAFMHQEAAHATEHAALNRLLAAWGVPVEAAAHSVWRWLVVIEWASSELRSAVAIAGEHLLGEIGSVILSKPELFADVDPRIARLFRWHAYEEVEHKAVLFDAFRAACGNGLSTYVVRIAGLWLALVLVASLFPAMTYRVLASAGAARDFRTWRTLGRFAFAARGGILRGCWRAIAAYHRRDFHPWRYLDDRRLLELRDTIIDPAWEASAR